jgi:multidrug efflux pump subunit AcrA (membrane-fusion protein)
MKLLNSKNGLPARPAWALVGLCAIALATAELHASNQDLIILDERGVANLRLETVEVEEQAFESTVFAIGRIEDIPAKQSVLSSRVSGRAVELNVFEGDTVERGDVIAMVETRQLGDPPPTIELKAPQDGTVIISHIRLGQPVQPDVELMDISDRSEMWAIAKIPEKEASSIGIGSRAYLRVPALGGAFQEATLVRFGVSADRSAGTVEGIFLVENADGRLRPGMRVEFSVVLRSRADVLAVPRESIQGDPANRVVFVKSFDLPNAFVRAPVVLGERSDRFVEVLRGVFPGDEVVTQGSYSLGFVGGGGSVSLKEALDAAHGHEHNEDGSEMADGQPAKRGPAEDDHDHEHGEDEHDAHGRGLLIYSLAVTVIMLILLQRLFLRKGDQANDQAPLVC